MVELCQGRCSPSFGAALTDSVLLIWVEETEEKGREVCRFPVPAQHATSNETREQADRSSCSQNAHDERIGRTPTLVLCSRNARPKTDGKGSLVVLLLAERARSECARSTRAIEDRLGCPWEWNQGWDNASSGRSISPHPRENGRAWRDHSEEQSAYSLWWSCGIRGPSLDARTSEWARRSQKVQCPCFLAL